jgi:hypothetical protein
MPRVFVNSLSDLVIQGGMVTFTLQDQAMRSEGDRLVPRPPEEVARIVMREGDFGALVRFLNERVADYEKQTGRSLGATAGPDR